MTRKLWQPSRRVLLRGLPGFASLAIIKPASAWRHGGVSSGYTAQAIHSDNTSQLDITSLSATDNSFVSFSFWAKSPSGPIWENDTEGDFSPRVYFNSNGLFVHLSDAHDNNDLQFKTTTTPGPWADGAWHHVLVSADTNFSAGNKLYKIYVDNIDVTVANGDTRPAFSMSYNGFAFRVFDGTTIDITDFWFAAGQSLLVGGVIPTNTRAKFIDGNNKPVYLGANGELPTGTTPTIFFSGDNTHFGQPNLGTGGAFTLTGALTNASSSPSD